MWEVRGFKAKKAAQKYRDANGGLVCWEERTPKRKLLTSRGKEYMIATSAINLDRDVYKFIVTKRI